MTSVDATPAPDINVTMWEPRENDYTPRLSTKSPLDFAYWALSSAEPYDTDTVVSDEFNTGFTGIELAVWCASQVGVTIPATIEELLEVIDLIPVEDAINTRGALVYGDGFIGISIGFQYVIEPMYDRYYVRKYEPTDEFKWMYGSLVPGLVY